MNYLLTVDHALFSLIAETGRNALFNMLMPALSDSSLWIAPLLIGWAGLMVFGKRKGIETALLCLVAVAATDAVCGNVLKPLFGRLRPGGGIDSFSFPSNHAANMFALATVITYAWRRYAVAVPAFFVAGAVGYSRVYVMAHYPTDVAAGALIGGAFALAFSAAYRYYSDKKTARKGMTNDAQHI